MNGRRISPTVQVAIDTAHAAVDADKHLSNTVDTAVLSLAKAGLLATPEQSLAALLNGARLALARLHPRAREVWTPADLIAVLDEFRTLAEAEAFAFTVYRADNGPMPLGTYVSAAAAREHCEAYLRGMASAMGSRLRTSWIADTPDEDSVRRLFAWDPALTDQDLAPDIATGLTVTPLEVLGVFDPDAEE